MKYFFSDVASLQNLLNKVVYGKYIWTDYFEGIIMFSYDMILDCNLSNLTWQSTGILIEIIFLSPILAHFSLQLAQSKSAFLRWHHEYFSIAFANKVTFQIKSIPNKSLLKFKKIKHCRSKLVYFKRTIEKNCSNRFYSNSYWLD